MFFAFLYLWKMHANISLFTAAVVFGHEINFSSSFFHSIIFDVVEWGWAHEFAFLLFLFSLFAFILSPNAWGPHLQLHFSFLSLTTHKGRPIQSAKFLYFFPSHGSHLLLKDTIHFHGPTCALFSFFSFDVVCRPWFKLFVVYL